MAANQIFRGPHNFFWLKYLKTCAQIFSSYCKLPFAALFVAPGIKPVYLLQKLEIPGNAINPGNERYRRKKFRSIFIFTLVLTHFQKKLGTICPSRVLISIFGRKSFSYPATLRVFQALSNLWSASPHPFPPLPYLHCKHTPLKIVKRCLN